MTTSFVRLSTVGKLPPATGDDDERPLDLLVAALKRRIS